jgi:hypothetical protein
LYFGKKIFKQSQIKGDYFIMDSYRSTIFILAVLIIFNYVLAVSPLQMRAEQMNKPINVMEPFIAVGNSGVILLILPIVFLILISDFPRNDGNSMFYLYRIGRYNWLCAQLLCLLLMILSYLFFIAMGAILPVLINGYIGDNWSLVVTDYATTFPRSSATYELLPENLYYQIGSVWKAAICTYSLLVLYLLLLGLLLCLGELNHAGKIGIVASVFLVAAGAALCSLHSKIMWVLPMSHTVVWLHFTKYFRKPVIELGWSYLYFGVINIALIICSFFSIKRYKFGEE